MTDKKEATLIAAAANGGSLRHQYRVVTSTGGEVVGFYCIGESAQVPSGVKVGAYRTQRDVVDFGIGMRPDLTGQGLGTEFLAHVLGQIVSDYLCADIRLTVAAFNNRAIRLYERFGFQMGIKFDHNGCVFQVMTRPHDD